MKLVKLLLLPVLALTLLLVAWPRPGQGQSLAELMDKYNQFKQDAQTYSDKIILVQNTVNSLYDDDVSGRVTPEGSSEARSANQQVRDLKESINKELALVKGDMPFLSDATQKLGLALDRYKKNQTQESLANAEGLVKLINHYQKSVNDRLDRIKNWCSQITRIRRATDEKEWDKLEGKYKDERQALDNLWNFLGGRPPVPDVVGKEAKEACALIFGMGLRPKIIGLTVRPPEGKEYTVKSQDPAPKTLVKPGDEVKIEVYRQVVPYVVGLKLSQAADVLAEARLKVGGVVVERAFSQKMSEVVTQQEPQVGELLPADRSVKLWHYDRFAPTGPGPHAVTPKATGFKPGDASLVDPLFASHEKLLENGRAIGGGHPGHGFPWQRHWVIKEFPTPEAAQAKLKKYVNDATKLNTGKWKDTSGEGDTRLHKAPDGAAYYSTSLGYAKNDGISHINVWKIYRDKFMIYYQERTKIYKDNLKKNWPTIYEKSIKLIDLRFPKK
jgi:hypothetical protein